MTTVCAMPNTKPVIDQGQKVADVHKRAAKESLTHVIQLGAVTIGQRGKSLQTLREWQKPDVMQSVKMENQ